MIAAAPLIAWAVIELAVYLTLPHTHDSEIEL